MVCANKSGRSALPLSNCKQIHIYKAFGAGVVFLALVLVALPSWASAPPKIKSILETAHELLGRPYRSGGSSPERGFDCSGFVSFVLAQNGIALGRSSPEQFKHGRAISRHELHPGDLVFFARAQERKVKANCKAKVMAKAVPRIYHVGIYIGKGEFIHAASGGSRTIQISELREEYWARHFYSARRI